METVQAKRKNTSPNIHNPTFFIEGISCLDCAAKFEKRVATLPTVEHAALNTATGKLSITGSVDIETIRDIGRSEDYIVHRDKPSDNDTAPSIPRAELVRAILSGVFIVIALLTQAYDAPSFVPPVFFFASIVIGGWTNGRKALYALPRFDFNMSVLMTVAVIGAMLIGEWTEGAVVAFLFAVSDLLEAWTYDRARRSIKDLMDVAPRTATIRRNDKELTVRVEDIAVGDIMLVRPGEKIAMDGTIIRGESAINEAPITGESIPAEKEVDDPVYAGTLNTHGSLEIRVTKHVEDTTLAKIVSLVEDAQMKQTPSQAFVDRFAAVYTPIVMALAAGIAVLPPLVTGTAWGEWIYRGLALLVVACPCALVLSTPISVVSAISNAARNGVLIKGGIHLEQAAKLHAIAFDKTGTITEGEPSVTDIVPAPGYTKEYILQIAASLEKHSEHPLAQAIVQEGNIQDINFADVDQFQSIAGHGVQGNIQGQTLYVGNVRLFQNIGHNTAVLNEYVAPLQTEGKTTMLIGTKKDIVGVIAVADQIRESALATLRSLKEAGIAKTVMLTGDNKHSAQTVAQRVGIDEVKAELLPEDKVTAVQELRSQYGQVGMVGDGLNDAPALATANIGIAMGGAGTDTSLEVADIVLMADDLSKLPFTVRLSRSALRIIKQNINFSIAIKFIAVLAVFPGWLTLWLAILADMGATVIVTLNGMRLLRHKVPQTVSDQN